jgi:uncharacterized membrane protein
MSKRTDGTPIEIWLVSPVTGYLKSWVPFNSSLIPYLLPRNKLITALVSKTALPAWMIRFNALTAFFNGFF